MLVFLVQGLLKGGTCSLCYKGRSRVCILRLTHPAVRNQQRILQLAAHLLVYHMPHSNLLLEGDDAPASDFVASAEQESPEGHSGPNDYVPPIEGSTDTDRGKKPLLPLLLSEGIYDVIVTALRAWVLVSALPCPFPCTATSTNAFRRRIPWVSLVFGGENLFTYTTGDFPCFTPELRAYGG